METTGTLSDAHEGGRPKLPEATVQEVRLLASPNKSLRRLSQEMGVSTSTCQRAAKPAKLYHQPCHRPRFMHSTFH